MSDPFVAHPRLPMGEGTQVTLDGVIEALTEREREVLVTLAAEGHSNTIIGEKLFISERTVRTHMCHLMDKLHVRSRVALVVKAQRLGLLQEPDVMSPPARILLNFIRTYPAAYQEVLDSGALTFQAQPREK